MSETLDDTLQTRRRDNHPVSGCGVAGASAHAGIVNVAAWLPLRAAEQPDKAAIVWRTSRDAAGRAVYSRWTFRELNEESDRYAHGLAGIGIVRGMRTILMVRPSAEFFALTFALYKIGAVPVLIDPGMGVRRMAACLRDVNAEAFIGIPAAQVLRITHRSAFRGVRIVISAGRRWFWGGHRLCDLRGVSTPPQPPLGKGGSGCPPLARGGVDAFGARAAEGSCDVAPMRPDEPAAIIFTTGSTGPPKGVLYLHGMFDAQVRILKAHFGIGADEIDLPTFPLFALFDPALGMTAVLPEMDPTRPAMVDPVKIIEAIRDNGVTHMFGSPALLDRVGRYGEAEGVRLPSLRRVISAGAAVPVEVIRRFSAMFDNVGKGSRQSVDAGVAPDALDNGPHSCDVPGTAPAGSRCHTSVAGSGLASEALPQIFTPYGATEALPVASIGSREILAETAPETCRGRGTCVGRPVPGVEVRIIRIRDEAIETWSDELVLPAGEIGEIVVKGPVVTREYCTSAAATRLAKIRDGDGVWHRMGDVGRMDESGRLWFYGRKAHRVETEHGTLFTEPVEAIFNQHQSVKRTALVGTGERPRQTAVLCVELKAEALKANGGEPADDLGIELLNLGSLHEMARHVKRVLYHPGSFPVDIRHNSKIFREKLAEWAIRNFKSSL